ncbi:MAG: hypothetical protein EOO46_22360, partial [Flavobacterium sp.]
MKHIFTFVFCLVAFVACKKEDWPQPNNYLQTVQKSLKDDITSTDYNLLDFSKSALTKVDSVSLYMLRVPFKQKSIENDFVLLQTDKKGHVQEGRIVHLEGSIQNDNTGKKGFDGNILIYSLMRQKLIESTIDNGFISAFHQSSANRSSLVQPSNVMPEVVITYVIPSGGSDFSWSSWIWLQSLFNGTGAQPYYSFFNSDGGSPWGSGGGGSTGGGSPTGGGGPIEEPPILIDFEADFEKEPIDIQKFVNCFNSVPDAGASCSIEISTDIPV